MKIYTRTGDTGTTGLFSGARVPKDHPRIAALGALDEISATLGIALAHGPRDPVSKYLLTIQDHLFSLGADMASPAEAPARIGDAEISWLENQIDHMTRQLPSLTNFILPGGTSAAAHIHLARAICRRAERDTFTLRRSEPVTPGALVYLNRLSDFLFTLARYENFLSGKAEIKWIPRK